MVCPGQFHAQAILPVQLLDLLCEVHFVLVQESVAEKNPEWLDLEPLVLDWKAAHNTESKTSGIRLSIKLPERISFFRSSACLVMAGYGSL